MDEDEECLPETSSMYTYLQDLGFSDVQVIKNEEENLINKLKTSVAKLHLPVKVIDKDVIDQIEVIASTKLLFEEDFSIVEILLSNFKVLNDNIPKIKYQDRSIGIVIFLGLCLYLMIGYFALVIISPFYAYKCTNYFNRKTQDKNIRINKIEIKKLLKVLRRNTSLLKNSVDYIKRKDRFLLLQTNHNELFQENEEVNFYFYSRFRSDFLSIINEMIKILCYSTKRLIKNIPLIDNADIPEYYFCSQFETNSTFDDPSKLYLLYTLVQSEFLRRIILTLIPAIHALPKNNFKLEMILRETTLKLTKLNKTLSNNFSTAFQGLKKQFKLNETKRSPGNNYAGEFISNFDDTINILTKLLLNCRLIEESLISGKIPQNIEASLVVLQTAIKDCQRNIENSFILLKKANAVTDGVNEEVEQKQTAINDYEKNTEKHSLEKDNAELQNVKKEGVNLPEEEIISDDNLNKIKVLDTNLANVIEDDVFEAYISKENQGANLNMDDWDFDEVLKDNLKREFSQNVMKELKGRLVEKAKNWKKREMNVLRKKGLIDNNNFELSKDEPFEVENETEEESCYELDYFEKQKWLNPAVKRLFSESAVKQYEQRKTQDCFGNACADFLKDLSETRKLILKLPTTEEELCFCSTDEEMFDEKSSE